MITFFFNNFISISIFILFCDFFFVFVFFNNFFFFNSWLLKPFKKTIFTNNLSFNFMFSQLFVFILLFFYSIFIFLFFDNSVLPYQIFTNFTSFFFFEFVLCMDGLSLLFIILLTFLIPVCFLINIYFTQYLFFVNNFLFNFNFLKFNYILKLTQLKIKYILFLIFLELILFFFFTTLDFLFFYILFESSVIPLFLMIGFFGSRINKIKASYYLLLFTVISSIPFLIGLLVLFNLYGTLNLLLLLLVDIPVNLQKILWIFFFLAFSVKIPIFPLHLWLPEAHVEASTDGSVILAGLLLKLGLYGILRFLIPLFPFAFIFFTPVVMLLNIISIIYVSFIIFAQLDLKKIIAYSSIIHMNFANLGVFSGTVEGIQGGIFLMFTHGFISSSLFILIGCLYSRYHTRLIYFYQGLSSVHPLLSLFFFLFSLGNLGFPFTGGFIGEFLIILGLFKKNIFISFLSLIGPFFGSIYSFLLFVRVFFGTISYFPNYSYKNLNLAVLPAKQISILSIEFYVLMFMSFFIIFTGVFPQVYLDLISLESIKLSSYILI